MERDGTELRDVHWASRLLGEPEGAVYRLVREGIVPAVRLGRKVKFDPVALQDFVRHGGRGLDEVSR